MRLHHPRMGAMRERVQFCWWPRRVGDTTYWLECIRVKEMHLIDDWQLVEVVEWTSSELNDMRNIAWRTSILGYLCGVVVERTVSKFKKRRP